MSEEIELIASEACSEIIKDLTDRRGLKGEWYLLDDDIEREIINEWSRIIAAAYRKAINQETKEQLSNKRKGSINWKRN